RHVPFLYKAGLHLPDWDFPLGISFFTLQQIMYLVDCYQELIPANGFLVHAAFVSFFPTVSSGPLTRARLMVAQLVDGASTNACKITQAISLLAVGLCKKVVLADSFRLIADAGFANPRLLSTVEAWTASFAYTFQIYFDFSGYSDMAIGAALLLGYTVPINFNTPYRSLSITEFWQRWHITLSQFITNYLYTPILRSFGRATLTKSAVATIGAMTIAGLWHGASLTFVVFGFLHGAALAINQIWRRKIKFTLPAMVSWAVTLLFVNLAFIFFRAPSLASGLEFCRALIASHRFASIKVFYELIDLGVAQVIFIPVVIGLVVAFAGENSNIFVEKPRPTLGTALAISFLILVSLMFMNSNLAKEFVYVGF
ncbi:MAG TPA: MBOAT family O-acyltransferase, partial [Candidatus Angelobacter sp.]|nr:MBOAT family O-acyltransferase [Candidatus Angelobacter sp.]